MSDVVVIGPASLNVIVEVDALPQPRPHTITALDHWRTLGGTSAGKALHLAALGRSTVCVTVLGDDEDAAVIRNSLERPGLTVMGLRGDGPSEHHLNLMTDRGERLSIYLDHGPAAVLGAAERGAIAAELAAARAIALDLSQLGRDLFAEVDASGTPVWVDLHDYNGTSSFHAPFIERARVLLMNGDGMADPVAFLRARVAAGTIFGICTLGAEGAVGVTSSGEVVRVSAVATSVVDTNGAGDAFTAGVMDVVLGAGIDDVIDAELLRSSMAAGARQAVTALSSRGLAPE